jgi:acyl transferase domain-containing protein
MSTPSVEENGIAIIGMAGRFPGASDVREFWKNLCAGVESVSTFTDEQLRGAGISRKSTATQTTCGRAQCSTSPSGSMRASSDSRREKLN